MNDGNQEPAMRLCVETAGKTEPSAAVAAADFQALLERYEALQRENDALRRQAAKGAEMLDAAAIFLTAYGDKYRNFVSGGIRPTAILHREVKVMWAVFKDIRGLTEPL
jgi:hypothetical protein